MTPTNKEKVSGVNPDNPMFRTNEDWEKRYEAAVEKIKELQWFADKMNEYVFAGEYDTEASALKVFRKLTEENRILKESANDCISLFLHETRMREKDEEILRLRSALERITGMTETWNDGKNKWNTEEIYASQIARQALAKGEL